MRLVILVTFTITILLAGRQVRGEHDTFGEHTAQQAQYYSTPRHCGHCDSVAKVDVSERDQSAPEAV